MPVASPLISSRLTASIGISPDIHFIRLLWLPLHFAISRAQSSSHSLLQVPLSSAVALESLDEKEVLGSRSCTSLLLGERRRTDEAKKGRSEEEKKKRGRSKEEEEENKKKGEEGGDQEEERGGMAAIRADFVCLALNLTLCTVFTGRYFTGDKAPAADSPEPAGFVLLHTAQPCASQQFEEAVRVLRPSVEKLVWNRALCPRDVELLQSVPNECAARGFWTDSFAPLESDDNVCTTAPYVRKGTKLYALSELPLQYAAYRSSPPGQVPWQTTADDAAAAGSRRRSSIRSSECSKSSLTRITVSDICEQAAQYEQGPALNPLRQDASFVLGRDKSSDRRLSPPPAPAAAAAEATATRRGEDEEDDEEEGAQRTKLELLPGAVMREVVNERGERVKEVDPDWIIKLAVAAVNQRDYAAAIKLYGMLEADPGVRFQMLIGRSTAYFFDKDYDKAFPDADRATKEFPKSSEAWRRRAAVYDARGQKQEAVDDLTMAIKLDPEHEDSRHLRGALAFHLSDFWTAIEDFRHSLKKQPRNPILYNAWATSLMGAGQYQDAVNVFAEGLQYNPMSAQMWLEKGRAHKELAQVDQALDCLEKARSLEESTLVYHRLASLYQLIGKHRECIKQAQRGLISNPQDIELNYLEGSSHHAVGDYFNAVRKYETILTLNPGNSNSAATLQFMAFYQREILAYTMSKLDQPLHHFNLCFEMDAKFKESWAKKLSPLTLFPGYEMISVDEKMLKAGPIDSSKLSAAGKRIVAVADRIGKRTQYRVPGFMPSRRQHRMAGLASLDLMQQVGSMWHATAPSLSINPFFPHPPDRTASGEDRGDDGGDGNGEFEFGDDAWPRSGAQAAGQPQQQQGFFGRGSGSGKAKLVIKGWRDVFNHIVRWRQLSEPSDTVTWIDELKNEYQTGFGSITAMTVGQMQNLKYYPLYDRGFQLLKDRLYDGEEAMNGTGSPMHISRAKHGAKIKAAKERKEVFDIVGENFYVTTQCYSLAYPGKIMNGTQLTLVESTRSYDFTIRMPVTPPRFDDFDLEFQAAFKDLTAAVTDVKLQRENLWLYRRRIRDNILRIGYYWYQLMPLTRGSAMVGFISIHGLSLAAGIEITAMLPEGMQIDWESILAPQFHIFNETVDHILYSNIVPAPLSLPSVAETFPTVRDVVAAMSYEDDS